MKKLITLSCATLIVVLPLSAAAWAAIHVAATRQTAVSVAEMTRIMTPLLADKQPRPGYGVTGLAPLPRRTPPLLPLPYLYGVYEDVAGRIARAYTLDRWTILLTLEPWIGAGGRATYRDLTLVPSFVELEIESPRQGRQTLPLVPFSHGTDTVWATTISALAGGFIGPITYKVRAWDASVPPPNRTPDNAYFNRDLQVSRLD